MEKFFCLNCGIIFDEDEFLDAGGEDVGSGNHIAKEQIYGVCPNCKSDDYTEAIECSLCQDYFVEEEMIDTESEPICKDCMERIISKFEAIDEIEYFYLEEFLIKKGKRGG